MRFDAARAAPVWIGLCLVLFLVRVFQIHAFGYFVLDDFNNLAMAMERTDESLLSHLANPFSDDFRPLVMLLGYRSLWRLFDIDPVPYHLVMWSLHAINVVLVYRVLQRVVQSRYAAASGALLFGYHFSYGPVLWEFGTVFEAACATFFLLGLLLHLGRAGTPLRVLACCACFYLAMKSKEMAITLPQAWLLAEALQVGLPKPSPPVPARRLLGHRLLARYAPAFALQVAFLSVALRTVGGLGAGDVYHMRLSLPVWVQQMGWYFDSLLRPMPAAEAATGAGWALAAGLTLAGLAWLRSRAGIYFLALVYLTMLPVAFLVNHRCAFYWYIPFLGIAGLFALVVRAVEVAVRARLTQRQTAWVGMVAFALLAIVHYHVQSQRGEPERNWATDLGRDYRSFLTGLRRLPEPRDGEVLYFRSLPPYFQESTLDSAVHVAFRRPDVRSAIVPRFPPEAGRFRLAFEGGRLVYPAPER